MKKLIALLMLMLVLTSIAGCDKKEPVNNIANSDRVVISYGASSHVMVSSDKAKIKALSDIFNNLRFEPTEKEMDLATKFHIIISTSENQNMTIDVDKNGVFWLNEAKNCLKVASGEFNYNVIKDMYDKSKDTK